MSGFANAVLGGADILKRTAIRSFNYVAGISGWTINKDGTAQFTQLTVVVQPNGAAVLIYFPTGGQGNLIGSWAAAEFTDQYGNNVPQGLNANGGQLAAITLNQPSMVGGVITSTLLNAVTIANAALNGGTSYEQVITFDTGGGLCMGYAQTTTTVTQTAAGDYTFTVPAGVTNLNNVYVIGAGAGANGGDLIFGGIGGAGGGFGGQASYPVTPGAVLSYTVGAGGIGSTTSNGNGGDGGDSFFDRSGQGVYAQGAFGNNTPGQGIGNTINHTGGTGGQSAGFTGGGSGGNSANPTGNGNNGLNASGSGGAAAPAAQTGSGRGGAGGASGANGNNGGSPGAGGGAAGKGSSGTGTLTKTYHPVWTGSYYGPDGSNPNARRSTTTMYQGGETASGGSYNGNQRCIFRFDSSQIQSDFAGYTPSQAKITLTNQHSWYNSGMTIEFDVGDHVFGGSSSPTTWPGHMNQIATGTIAEGDTHTYGFSSTVAGYYINNQTDTFGLGANVPGNHAYDLNYYGYFAAGTSITLTIVGTKVVSGSLTSGNGADGSVTFQYTSTQVLQFALSPVAGTDSGGNAFAAGYTGQVSVFQPGSSPAVVETWHNFTWAVSLGFTGTAKYKLMPGNCVRLFFAGTVTSTGTASTNAIPSAYWPVTTVNFTVIGGGNSPARAQLTSSGVVAIVVGGTGGVSFCQDIPLD